MADVEILGLRNAARVSEFFVSDFFNPMGATMKAKRFRPIFLGLVSLSLATGAARAADGDQAQPTSQPDLQSQVNALNAQVQELKAQQNASVTTPTLPEPTTQDASNFGGGWNPALQQFYIGNPDGNFYFHPGVIFQGRYDADWHRSPDKWTNGFELRCCRFTTGCHQ